MIYIIKAFTIKYKAEPHGFVKHAGDFLGYVASEGDKDFRGLTQEYYKAKMYDDKTTAFARKWNLEKVAAYQLMIFEVYERDLEGNEIYLAMNINTEGI